MNVIDEPSLRTSLERAESFGRVFCPILSTRAAWRSAPIRARLEAIIEGIVSHPPRVPMIVKLPPSVTPITDGVSGPAIKTLILRPVRPAARSMKISVVACGGIG